MVVAIKRRAGDAGLIGQTLDTVSPAECRNYFINSGYEPT
jgi:hypothetical protein